MVKKKTIALILPAYNEAGLIGKTIVSAPKYVDHIIPIDDGSTDSTWLEIKKLAKEDSRVQPFKHQTNQGLGASLVLGIKQAIKLEADYTVIAAGDNQCDLSLIKQFVTICEIKDVDVCRGNRFLLPSHLSSMPNHRLFGNLIYSFIVKFVSGYYSLFDFLSSYSAIKTARFRQMDLSQLRQDYLFDNSLWINLSIINAKIREVPAPAIYANEKSDINYFRFILSSIPYLTQAFLKRIYLKYIFRTHPIGLFFISGSLLFFFGLCYGLYVAFQSLGPPTASTATVMLAIVPFILGFQLLLQAVVLDIQNEPK